MSARPAAPGCGPGSAFSPRFLVTALVLTLTLGAGSGMFYLWRIGAGADVPISHRQIHAHSQLLGFAALFVMGIAFQALPRMLGAAPASRRLMSATLWLMLWGVLLRNLGQPFAYFGFGRVLSFASGALEAAGGLLFAVYAYESLAAAPRDARGRREPLVLFELAGLAYLVATLALSTMQGAWIAAQRDAILPGSLNEPFYFLSLQGFLMASIFGFGSRMVPTFLGIGPWRRPLLMAALALQALACIAYPAAFVPGVALDGQLLRDAGTLLAALSAACYLGGTGVLWRRRQAPAPTVPGGTPSAIRAAFWGLALWAALAAAGVAVSRLSSFPAQNPWWLDAARHVFTLGFLTLLIVAVSHRVVPAFSGRPLFSPRLAVWTYALLVLGTAMRLLQYPGAFNPVLYQIGSYMGLPAVAALVLFTVNVVKTVKPRRGGRDGVPFAATLPAR